MRWSKWTSWSNTLSACRAIRRIVSTVNSGNLPASEKNQETSQQIVPSDCRLRTIASRTQARMHVITSLEVERFVRAIGLLYESEVTSGSACASNRFRASGLGEDDEYSDPSTAPFP